MQDELEITDQFISIHALRVEGDVRNVYDYLIHDTISIHALRVEGDLKPPPDG